MVTEVSYLFPGQGAQYVGMGRQIYQRYPLARKIFDKSNEVLDFNLTKLCFEGPSQELTKTENCQPAILTSSIACLEVLRSQVPEILDDSMNREGSCADGLKPGFAAGLSLGEYSALVASGSLAFEDALVLVRKRALFMKEASERNPGKMAAIIGLKPDKVQEICRTSFCEIANMNSPGQVVISGGDKAVDKALELAKEEGAKKAVILEVSGPFHCSLMNWASRRLRDELEKTTIFKPKIPVVSNVTADIQSEPEQIKENLSLQVSSTTHWEKSIRFMTARGIKIFLEIGPGKVLRGLLRGIDPGLKVYNMEGPDDIESIKRLLQL
jgi:[acyl-carrier-protein] S-malonyltransferase